MCERPAAWAARRGVVWLLPQKNNVEIDRSKARGRSWAREETEYAREDITEPMHFCCFFSSSSFSFFVFLFRVRELKEN